MDIHSLEYQRAETLDQIFNLVSSQSSGQQILFAKLAVRLRMDDKSLGKLLADERKIFKVITTGMNMANGKQASFVSLTQFGKEHLEKGWTYIKQLEENELAENQRRKLELAKHRWAWAYKLWGIGSTALFMLFAYLTWDATKENKVHNEKEERWEQEKVQVQSQINQISKQLNAIPDSAKALYIK